MCNNILYCADNRVGSWLYRNRRRLSSGDVPVGEMACGAGHREEVAGTEGAHTEAVVKECDYRAVLQDKHLVGGPSTTDAGDVVGSRVLAAAAAGRAEAGDAGTAIEVVVVDNQPMEEEALAVEVLEAGSTWKRLFRIDLTPGVIDLGEKMKMDADVMTEMEGFFGAGQSLGGLADWWVFADPRRLRKKGT